MNLEESWYRNIHHQLSASNQQFDGGCGRRLEPDPCRSMECGSDQTPDYRRQSSTWPLTLAQDSPQPVKPLRMGLFRPRVHKLVVGDLGERGLTMWPTDRPRNASRSVGFVSGRVLESGAHKCRYVRGEPRRLGQFSRS